MRCLPLLATALFFSFISVQNSEAAVVSDTSQSVNFEEKNGEAEAPDPLSLNKNWWSYFRNAGDQFPKRVAEFKASLTTLSNGLQKDEHQSLVKLIERLIFHIDIYYRKLQQQKQQSEQISSLQFLPKYTIDQLFQVNRSLLTVQSKLQNEVDKLNAEKSKLTKIINREDELALGYQKTPEASFNRLKKGLEIVNARFDQAISEEDISILQKKIDFMKAEGVRLGQELKHAQENIDFSGETENSLNKALSEAEVNYEIQTNLLQEIKRKAFYEEQKSHGDDWTCCLWDNKILAQSIRTEIFRLQVLIAEFKYHLFLFVKDPTQFSISELQTIVARLNKKIVEVKMLMKQWEREIEDEQARIGTEAANAYQQHTGEESTINQALVPIHLEIDQALQNLRELNVLTRNAELLVKNFESKIITSKSLYENWWMVAKNQTYKFSEMLGGISDYTVVRIHNEPVTILRMVEGLLIVIAAIMLSKFSRNAIQNKQYIRKRVSKSNQYIIARCLHYIFIIAGALFALSFIGVDFTNFLIFLGALGVGIGFGLQSTINNIFSGFLLLFQRNIKVGDIVEIQPDQQEMIGSVREINLQNTHIKSFEGVDLIVPNAQLTSQILNNWTLEDACRRFRVPFKVPYQVDKKLVRKIVIEGVKNAPSVKKNDVRYPDPQVWFKNMGEYAMEFELVAWVDLNIPLPNDNAKSSLLWEIETALQQHGIEIPVPQRDVSIKDERSSSKKAD